MTFSDCADFDIARDELRGCLIRRAGQTCEVRKEFLQIALVAMDHLARIDARSGETACGLDPKDESRNSSEQGSCDGSLPGERGEGV